MDSQTKEASSTPIIIFSANNIVVVVVMAARCLDLAESKVEKFDLENLDPQNCINVCLFFCESLLRTSSGPSWDSGGP